MSKKTHPLSGTRRAKLSGKKGGTLILDAEDAHLLKHAWFRNSAKRGYVVRTMPVRRGDGWRNKTICLSRVIMQPPPGMVVDHINGNALDNRRRNLRIVTQRQNATNNRIPSGQMGRNISYRPDRRGAPYWVRVSFQYKRVHCGTYWTLREARVAAKNARKKYGYLEGARR